MRKTGTVASIALFFLAASVAAGDVITYTFAGLNAASGNTLSAAAEFELTGSQLYITLTSTSRASVPTDVLTGLFWYQDDAGAGLEGVSAILGADSTVINARKATVRTVKGKTGLYVGDRFLTSTYVDEFGNAVTLNTGDTVNIDAYGHVLSAPGVYAGRDVGAEWAYEGGIEGYIPPNPNDPDDVTNFGISSSGLGLFGTGQLFDPRVFNDALSMGGHYNLVNPECPDGLQYGVAGGLADNANPNLAAETLLVSSVIFTFDIAGAFGLDDISNVYFNYGTSIGEGSYQGTPDSPGGEEPVPEPATVGLLGLGVLGIMVQSFRKRII